jgi:MFS family permease
MMATRTGNKYVSALRQHDLRTLVIAFVTDGAPSWCYNVVLISYVFDRTHSASWVTAIVTVRWVVGMAFGGYAGVLSDRFDRRSVLLGSAVLATVATLAIALVVAVDGPLLLLVAAAAALSAVITPIRPASGALIPEVVAESDLIAANSIFALLESVIVVIGPGIGALLLLTSEPVYGILFNAASYVVSGVLYATLRVRSRGSAEPGGNVFKQWGAGVAALGQHRKALVLTMFLVLDSAAVGAATVLMPALSEHLDGGSTGFSLLLAANALGGVAAAALANKFADAPKLTLIIFGSITLQCVPLWVCVYVVNVPNGMALQLVSGAGMVIVDILAFTALQRDLPRDVLGRVLGSVDVLILGGNVLITIVTSQLYSHVGLKWALAVVGLGFPALALLGLPALRSLGVEAVAKVAVLQPRITLLEGLDLFAGAPRRMIEQLADAAVPETVPAGTVLITQGDTADALWILTEGELGVSAVRDDGVRVGLPTVTAPDYVGELGLVHRRPRTATVVAVTECQLLRIPGQDFLAAIEDAPPSPMMLGRAGVRMARTTPTADQLWA